MRILICWMCLFLLVSSCGYKKPQKDIHPEIKHFPAFNTSNNAISLKQFSNVKENVQSIILTENKLYVFSYVSNEENAYSPDSLSITIYNSVTDFKKYYYKIDEDHNLTFYEVKMKGKDIYTNRYQFLYPDYRAIALDSNDINTLSNDTFVTPLDEKNEINYFDEIAIGNKQCGGKFSIPIVCQYYLRYYKMKVKDDSIMFKVNSREHQNYGLKYFTFDNQAFIFSNLGLYYNGKIFILT